MVKDKNLTLAEIETKMKQQVSKANAAISKKDKVALYDLLPSFTKLEDDYEGIQKTIIFDRLKAKPSPKEALVLEQTFITLRHKVHKDKDNRNVITKVTLEEVSRPLILLEFCKYAKLCTDWQYPASKGKTMLALKTAEGVGYTAHELQQILDSKYIMDAARDIDMGKTPTSNTQIVKLLQSIIDAMIFRGDGEQNELRVNNYDANFLIEGFAVVSKKRALTLKMPNDRDFHRSLTQVCYRLLTGGRYDVDYGQFSSTATKAVIISMPAAKATPKAKNLKPKKKIAA
jgi:hypothetical protein